MSFRAKQVATALRKAMPGMVAQIDVKYLRIEEDDDGVVFAGDWSLDENWKPVCYTEGRPRPENFLPLPAAAVLGVIIKLGNNELD
jgi:hypothetical protein